MNDDDHHQSYRGVHPNSSIGQAGKSQGFNTGVCLHSDHDDIDYQDSDDNDYQGMVTVMAMITFIIKTIMMIMQVVLFNLEKMRMSNIYTEEAKLDKMVIIISTIISMIIYMTITVIYQL